jgi:maleate isomerase
MFFVARYNNLTAPQAALRWTRTTCLLKMQAGRSALERPARRMPKGHRMDLQTRRFGVLVPPANVTVEDEFRRYTPRDVQYHVARLSRRTLDTNVDSLSEMVESTERAAAQVAQTRPEVIVWACTSGSFIKGKDHDEEINRRIRDASGGVASITTSTAMIAALQAVSARRVFLVTPYIADLNAREERFLEANGFAVTHTASFFHPDTIAIRRTPSAEVARLVHEHVAQAGSFDAIFISCTQLHSLDQVAGLEAALGIPVVTSNQATLWAALTHMGIDTAQAGTGRLMTGTLQARPGVAA